MGASGWEYLVPYQADLQAALDELRRQVFESGDYISPVTWGLPAPESVEALVEQEVYQDFWAEGTHTIIDVLTVVPYDMGEQEPATVCPFTDEEYEDYFGSTRPTRADWERFRDDPLFGEYVAERWTGRAMILWAGDAPSETGYGRNFDWGSSYAD
jgi:hypothetical protein